MAKGESKNKKTWDGLNWSKFINDIVENHPLQENKFKKMAICIDYVKGDQYKTIDITDLSTVDVSNTGETRSIYNVLGPFMALWKAQMIAEDPIPVTYPHQGNTERFDTDVARVCNILLPSWWFRQKMKNKLDDALYYGGTCGLGAFKMVYDAEAGERRIVNKEKAKEFGFEYEKDEVNLGEIVVEVVDSYKEYFPDPLASNDDECRFVIYRFKQSKDVIEDKFGKPRGYFKRDDPNKETRDLVEATISADRYHSEQKTKQGDIVYVYELWMKADKKYPNGRHVIVVDDEEMLVEDNPRPDNLPTYTFKINGKPDEYIGDGKVWPSITLQRDMNKCKSSIMHNVDWCSGTKILCPTEGGIANDKFDTTAGERIDYSGGFKPEYLMAPPLPEHILRNADEIFSYLQIIWGLPDVHMGAIPERGSQTSGVVIDKLQRAASLAHQGDVEAISAIIRRMAFDYLVMCQEYYSEFELAAIVGENRLPEIRKFLDADINQNSLDIKIDLGKGYGQTPEARMDTLLKFMQLRPNLFTDTQLQKALTNFANIDALVEDTLLDQRKAERNLDKIVGGETTDIRPLTSPYDNHAIHIKVFTDYIKKPEWDELDMGTKDLINQYIGLMQDNMAQMAMANQQAMPPQGGMRQNAPQGGGVQPMGGPTALDRMKAEDNMHMATGQPVQPGGGYPAQS